MQRCVSSDITVKAHFSAQSYACLPRGESTDFNGNYSKGGTDSVTAFQFGQPDPTYVPPFHCGNTSMACTASHKGI